MSDFDKKYRDHPDELRALLSSVPGLDVELCFEALQELWNDPDYEKRVAHLDEEFS